MSGVWSSVEVGGKQVDIYDPPGPGRPRFGLLYLHTYGLETLADNATFTRLFARHNLACAFPQGMHSWWTDRVCPEFDERLTAEHHLLDNVLPYSQTRWQLEPRNLAVLGISMGGQGALRLAFRHPQRLAVAAGISSAIEYHELYGQGTTLDEMYDSKEQCRQDTAPMHIQPSHPPPHLYFAIDPDDDWLRGNERLHEKLSALGVPHEIDFTIRAGGHSWNYFEHMAERVIAFLVAGLEQQSRRLL